MVQNGLTIDGYGSDGLWRVLLRHLPEFTNSNSFVELCVPFTIRPGAVAISSRHLFLRIEMLNYTK